MIWIITITMGCASSAPEVEVAIGNDIVPDAPIASHANEPVKRTITLTTVASGLVKKISLRSSSPLDLAAVDEELLLSKHGLYYTLLNTKVVIDVDTCELIGHLDSKGAFHAEINQNVKDVAAQHKLAVRPAH